MKGNNSIFAKWENITNGKNKKFRIINKMQNFKTPIGEANK